MKKAVIYGAGNIGRGFIGQLLTMSGYEVAFMDINKEVIGKLNEDRQYPITIVSNDGNREIIVKNVYGIDSSVEENAIKAIFEADIMSTSLGVNVLRFVAKTLAKAIEMRIDAKRPPLNILLCENLIDANIYLKNEIFKYLSDDKKAVFDQNIGLVEASIGRMVPVLPKKEGDNILRVAVEEFDVLHLDRDGFVGELPDIYNTRLCSPFNLYIQRKLFIHNMCHCVCAHLGAEKYDYISEAIEDLDIKYIVEQVGVTSARAIALENGGDVGELIDFLNKLLYRFYNKELKDTIARVGKDPIRKLKKIDRLTGAYLLAKKHGIDTTFNMIAFAAALCFRKDGDEASFAVNDDYKTLGVVETLKKYTEVEFTKEEGEVIENYCKLIEAGDLKAVIKTAERLRAKSIPNK